MWLILPYRKRDVSSLHIVSNQPITVIALIGVGGFRFIYQRVDLLPNCEL